MSVKQTFTFVRNFTTNLSVFGLWTIILCDHEISVIIVQSLVDRQILKTIIQHIVTLPIYGHGELNIRRPLITDILRYT